eukprot:1716461-Amphidinium_carterae.1
MTKPVAYASVTHAALKLLMSEPEPEADIGPKVAMPVLIDLEGLCIRAASHTYVVWRLENSPDGEYTFEGVHIGHASWEGLQSLLATGAYVRGRDKLCRVEIPPPGDVLVAAQQVYLDERQVHGSPNRVRVWFWPSSCEALVREAANREASYWGFTKFESIADFSSRSCSRVSGHAWETVLQTGETQKQTEEAVDPGEETLLVVGQLYQLASGPEEGGELVEEVIVRVISMPGDYLEKKLAYCAALRASDCLL